MLTLALLLQVIPDDRTGDWTQAGLPPDRPVRTRIVEVTGDPQAAIDAAKPDDILLLPAGTYDGLRLRSRITLRGEGPAKTIIKGSIQVGSGGADWWYPDRLKLDVQGRRGDPSLRVSDTSKLKPGQMVQLSRRNDAALPVISTGGVEFLQRQVTRIMSKTATHVTVSPAPLFDLPEGSRFAPTARATEFVGIEDLGVEDAGSIGISLTSVYGCWVKNVAVRFVNNHHITISDALHCEVSQCLVSTRAEGHASGAGISLSTSSHCKIEDNVIVQQYPHIEIHASSGNVIAYNFCRDSDIWGVLGASISSNHGPHSGFNLYEGNVAPKFQADGYHGSGSHDTLFRNRLHGTSLTTRKLWVCVNLNRFTRNASVVGNVLGAPGHPWLYDQAERDEQPLIYSFGLPHGRATKGTQTGNTWKDWGTAPGPGGFQELDLDVRRTTILKGNFNYKDGAVPADEATSGPLPPSLYLKEKPAWWGDLAWPPFGPDTDFRRNRIPAETRE